MWLVRCPYVTDAEGSRVPKIAADLGCTLDGASSQLDTGMYAPSTRQALVVVDIHPHDVQAWARSQAVDVDVRRIGAGSEVSDIRAAKRLDPPVRVTKTRANGTTFDVLEPRPLGQRSAAHAEYRAAIREAASGVLRPYQIAFGAQMLVPFIATLGAYGAARALGLPVDALLALLASYGLSLGAVLGTDDFSEANGTEIHGKALDTGGGAWNVIRATATGQFDVQSGEWNVATGSSNNVPDSYADRGGGAAVGDQYAQAVKAGTTRSGPSVRVQTSAQQGYGAWMNGTSTRIYRDNTQIASGTGGAAALFRLEIITDDLELFVAGVSEATALNDTTYTSGFGGLWGRDTGTASRMDDFEWGDFSAGGGGAPVDVLRSHLLTSNLLRGLAR